MIDYWLFYYHIKLYIAIAKTITEAMQDEDGVWKDGI